MKSLLWLTICLVVLSFGGSAYPDDDQPTKPGGLEATAARYHQLLLRQPKRGTAFDMLYRLYLDAGRGDELVAHYEQLTKDEPKNASAFVVLALVQERRGRNEEAIKALERASELVPKDFYPHYCRALLLAEQHRDQDAVQALTKALENGPPRAELMEIYKRLGRLQARQGKTAEALKAWATLASLFPQDRFALQELGELLTEEEQLDEAIKYYNRLADLSKDDGYRRLITRVEVGQIQVRQGKLKTAIATFDECLAQVEPESWVARDIRRRIEEIFLRSDDLNGLSEYYRDRLKRQPDDLNAMVRLAATTDRLGDRKAALEQYRAAVKLAPARKDLREAMIAELVRADKLAEALAEAVALAEKNPADIDAWKRVGELSLKAASPADRSKAEAEALEAWRRIAALRPADPALAVQAAELCRQAAGI